MLLRGTIALRITLALALVAAIALIPAVTPSSCMVGTAQGKPLRADSTGEFAPHRGALGVPVAEPEPESSLDPVPAAAPATVVTREPASPPGGEEAEVPAADPVDPPVAARIDPLLAGPSDLFGIYYPQGWGNSRNDLEWTFATDPTVTRYLLEEWTSDDFTSMVSIFNQLVVYEPSAATPAADFQTHTTQAMQAGLTIAEREDIADLIEIDLDWLFAIISSSTVPEVWDLWDDLVALSPLYEIDAKKNTYQRNKLDLNIYYFYVVVAEYPSLDTSPPSNSWGMFAYDKRSTAPAQPTGFTAIAYDPGVALEWDRNLEMDLVGYNVYLLDGASEILLNTSGPITHGTEYFDMDGLEGATYLVRAINSNDVLSTAATAISVLAAATYYYADDPGWTDVAGVWVLENYTSYGGYILRVAQNPPSRTSFTFTGKRVGLYCATYCQSANVRVWVDGVDEGTYSLYSVDPAWGVSVCTVTGLEKDVPHTIEVECLGTGGTTIPDSDPPTVGTFVNVQYIEVR